MNKKKLSLFLIIFLALLLVFYIIITSEKVEENYTPIKNKTSVDIKALTSNYERDAVIILDVFLGALIDDDVDARGVSQIKANYLEIVVPEIYKEIHLEAILAFESMEHYFVSGNKEERNESIVRINDIRTRIASKI